MKLEAKSRPAARWWDDVDRLFAALPPALFRQLKLLEYDLALRYSSSGQFHDIFSSDDQPPILIVAPLLLDDLDMPSGARDEANRHLFVASVLLAVRVQVVDGLDDPAGFTTDDRIALVQWLSERAAAEIGRVIPGDSPYWDSYDAVVTNEAARMAASTPGEADPLLDEPDTFLAGPFVAPLRLLGIAAVAAGDRLDLTLAADEMLRGIAEGYQVVRDLATLRTDADRGHVSYPIAFIARAAHLALRPVPKAEVLLGAMVATGSLGRITQSALDRLRTARRIATELELQRLAAFLNDAEAHLAEAGEKSARLAVSTPPRTRPVSKALQMAEGYLLADPTYRESWEMHREGMLGEREVASRFPMGLVLEILHNSGLDVRQAIDSFLDFTVANGFRYYDHPGSGVDTDTIGVVLRLRPHATSNADHDRALAAVLDCLGRNVREARTIPVWISGCAGAEKSKPSVIALGERCGTVAAHLLLGTLTADAAQDATAIGAQSLVDRIGSVGVAANVNYPPAFALGAFFRLLKRLAPEDVSTLIDGVEAARSSLTDDLRRAVSMGPVTAQDAALLTLACLEADRQDFIDPGWLVQVLKRQRFDGSWTGEPFAAAPNRGRSVSWYSSSLLTTALCYDALARGAKQLPASVV